MLYRGPLSSCNYGCEYCPFAKRVESRQALQADRAAWERFVDWAGARPAGDDLRVFVTPWGEALVRRWYQEGLSRLTAMAQVSRCAIQTNLSGSLKWLDRCPDLSKLGLWCTYHPEWTEFDRFIRRCRVLDALGVAYSVGVVAFAGFLPAAQALRAALRPEVYLWANAVKARAEPYSDAEVAAWTALDPLFPVNLRPWTSRGHACGAGERVVSVDGDGTVRRCHFIREPLGNLYVPGWEAALQARPCSNATCHCHIGYAHLDYLNLDQVFGSGLLERAPSQPWRTTVAAAAPGLRALASHAQSSQRAAD